MTRQNDSQLGHAPTPRNRSGPPERGRIDLSDRPPPWVDDPTTLLGGQIDERGDTTDPQRWSGEWSSDELLDIDVAGDGDGANEMGASRLDLAVARAKQKIAERQVVELSHRFVNILQTLASRIERQKRMHSDPQGQDDLDAIVTRVYASGRLHRLLLPPQRISSVDLGSLLLTMGAAIDHAIGLRCLVDTESFSVSNEVAVHLAAAVYELAWNAHKHAYGGTEGGVIRIVCRRDAERRVLLSVADRGCGLPIDFHPHTSRGVGLMLVYATVTQFGGDLRIESDRGACFTLRLNIPFS